MTGKSADQSKRYIVVGFVALLAFGTGMFFLAGDEALGNRADRTAASASVSEHEQHFPLAPLLEPDKLRALKVDALLGKPASAGQLVKIFENCLSRHQTGSGAGLPPIGDCEREMNFWIIVGSENGDLNMMGLRFNEYFSRESCVDSYRGKYWLEKILEQNSEEPWPTMREEIEKKINKCKW